MNYILNKKDGGFEIFETNAPVLNSYSRIRVDKQFIDSYNINVPCYIGRQDTLYSNINEYFNKVVSQGIEERVPNKRVKTDIIGTSKLVRTKDKQCIEIAFRRRNKSGQLEQFCKSNNVCYISDDIREYFFSCSKSARVPEVDSFGKWHYKLYYGDNTFNWWSDFMDKEYIRLCSKLEE